MKKQTVLLIFLLLTALIVYGQDTSEQVDAKEIIKRIEDLMRSRRAYSEMEMEIVTPDWKRTLAFKNWDDREGKRSFIHILAPARDKDTTFLRLDMQLWSYLPRAERTLKIPPSMMLQSWMGSDFTNDDLVRESSYVEDYDHEWTGTEEVEGYLCDIIILRPKPDAPVTWGKVIIWVSREPFTPMKYEFYNRREELRRTMIMGGLLEIDDRTFPSVWTMTTEGKEGHETIIRINKIEFDMVIPERVFTQQYLRNPR